MKLNFTDITYDAKPHEFNGATLYIRPYPESMKTVAIRGGSVIISGEERWKVFDYSLEKAENITDADGKTVHLADDVRVGKKTVTLKRAIYDFNLDGIAAFVAQQSGIIEAEKAEEEQD